MDVNDVIRIVRVAEARVSPRGDVASLHLQADLDKNRNFTELRIYRRDGSVVFFKPGEGDSRPRWSPDASMLAFTSRRGAGKDDKGQGIYVVSTAGGEPRRVAWFKHGIGLMEWYDSSHIIASIPTPREGEHDEDYVATERLPFWFDQEGLVAGLDDALSLVDWDSGHVEKLVLEQWVGSLTVCGGRVYYTVPKDWRFPYKTVLKTLRPGKEPEVLLEDPVPREVYCTSTGELYMLASHLPIGMASHNRLYRVDPDTGEARRLLEGFEPNIWGIIGELDNRPVLNYVWRGASILAVLERDERVERITGEREYVTAASAHGGVVAYWKSTPIMPPELYIRSPDEEERRLTSVNKWFTDKYKPIEPRQYSLETQGDRIDYWVLDPKPGEAKPVILFVHGGPKGMYGHFFHPEMQYYASQGFLIVYANPRGSDGYGEEFADIRGAYGERDFNQLMDVLDKAVVDHQGDSGKMVITGISYGGYMTNVAVVKTDKFAAAVSENGIADWTTDFWSSDIGYWFDPDQIGRTPHDNLSEYLAKSPAYHTHKAKTPLLLIHSMEDYRCPIDQALAMHTSMLMNGKKSRLIVFRRGSHGFSVRGEPRTRKKRLELKTKWIKETLGIKDEAAEKSS